MDPTPWIKFRAKNAVKVLGHFKNEYGERYIVYRMENGDTLYFTGDEVDWGIRERLVGTKFMFNSDERDKIAKIVWPTMDDVQEFAVRVKERGEEPDQKLWRPWEDRPEPEITDGSQPNQLINPVPSGLRLTVA